MEAYISDIVVFWTVMLNVPQHKLVDDTLKVHYIYPSSILVCKIWTRFSVVCMFVDTTVPVSYHVQSVESFYYSEQIIFGGLLQIILCFLYNDIHLPSMEVNSLFFFDKQHIVLSIIKTPCTGCWRENDQLHEFYLKKNPQETLCNALRIICSMRHNVLTLSVKTVSDWHLARKHYHISTTTRMAY